MVSSRRAASKSTPCTYHGALIPKAASNSWVWFIGSRCLAGLVAAFCRNQPSLSLLLQRASSIRFAGLAPVLDPPTHPLRIEKRQNEFSLLRCFRPRFCALCRLADGVLH